MRNHWTSTWRQFVFWIVMDCPFWSWTRGLLGGAAMRWTLGKHSTRIPSVLSQLCPKLCVAMNFWTTITCPPRQYLIVGSRSSFQGMVQNLKIRKPLHARDWWLLHHWPKTIVSMKNHPSQLYSLHRSHQIVRLSTFQKSRTSVSLWDIFLSFWWSVKFPGIVSHEHRCVQCRRHKHSTY